MTVFFAISKMKRVNTSILVLVLFVSVYIFCICAYTFISGMNYGTYADKKFYPVYESFSRLRRAAVLGKNDTWKTNISLNVCCAPNEYLNLKLECVKANDTGDYKGLILSESAVVDEDWNESPINLDRILMNYNLALICPRDEMTVITWAQGEIYSHYISQKNGYLLELSDDRKTLVSNYSTSSFCLDAMMGQENTKFYVALLCPCEEKVCIQKCCPNGFYFNTVNKMCQKEIVDGIQSYHPDNPDNVSYHLMYNKSPECNNSNRMIRTENKVMPFSLLQTGQLMRYTEMFNKKQYCLDNFSNGKNHSSFESGFYCPNEPEPLIDKLADKYKAKTSKYNSDTQDFINLKLFLLVSALFSFV